MKLLAHKFLFLFCHPVLGCDSEMGLKQTESIQCEQAKNNKQTFLVFRDFHALQNFITLVSCCVWSFTLLLGRLANFNRVRILKSLELFLLNPEQMEILPSQMEAVFKELKDLGSLHSFKEELLLYLTWSIIIIRLTLSNGKSFPETTV
ncbi:CLUMA_CG010090, isoform A [Clunio marinus]|uniref:CLUMA_CG010090, isoform A n=1 Tax=Clunio marinus TaxID=568069 RepID=A0A1J1IE55_9DIPT|nr:CLUMA_CG010090, isoform A [Clunio marinus]